jgi:phosphomevalonate kinase
MSVSAVAPGKLLLAGAYAVLTGAPAIVYAVERVARVSRGDGPTTTEVGTLGLPYTVNVARLEMDGRKLGLGSSAAALVAALALRAHEQGEDVGAAPVRDRIYTEARATHARVQGGGSGVDVAASTYGGVLRFQDGRVEPATLPAGVHVTAFFSGASARTSELLARVDALAKRDPRLHAARLNALGDAATKAFVAASGDAAAFVAAVSAHGRPLEELGIAADAPIVLPAFAELGRLARDEAAAFIPSGAGGGDVGVFVGTMGPSASFLKRAASLSMTHLPVAMDSRGVRIEPHRTAT